jgi:hypothetical protein
VWKLLSARGAQEFMRHVVPAVLKPARTLWNEIIGFLFFCLAVLCGSGAVRSYLKLDHVAPERAAEEMLRLALSTFCTLLMLWFAVGSFLRARRISKS